MILTRKDADAINDHKVKPKLTKGTKDWYDVIKVLEAGKDWNYIERSYSVENEHKVELEKLIQKPIKN